MIITLKDNFILYAILVIVGYGLLIYESFIAALGVYIIHVLILLQVGKPYGGDR